MYSLFFLYLSEQIYKIMKIKLLLISFLLAANALGAAAQVSKTYYVSKPGTLISMMTEEEANSVTHLTLTGKLNAEDFRHLRDEFDNLKTWQKIVLGVTWAAVTAKDYYDHFLIDSSVASQSSDGQQRKSIELYRSVNMEKDNSLILTPIKNRLDESFKKNW